MGQDGSGAQVSHSASKGGCRRRSSSIADPSKVHRLLEEQEFLRESASWVEDLWSGKPKGWFLAQLGIAHNYGHMYEANTVRCLMGIHGR